MPKVHAKRKYADPFQHVYTSLPGQKCDERYIDEIGVEVDPKTLRVKPVVTGKKDLVAEIQANKEMCGMHLAQVMMCHGQDVSKFADDGKSGMDTTEFSPDPLIAHEQAVQSKLTAEEMLAKFGLKYEELAGKSQKEIDAAFKAAIEAKMASTQVKEQNNG